MVVTGRERGKGEKNETGKSFERRKNKNQRLSQLCRLIYGTKPIGMGSILKFNESFIRKTYTWLKQMHPTVEVY